MTATTPLSLGCLSRLQQLLPTLDSWSFQVILNPLVDRGGAWVGLALAWGLPRGCQGGVGVAGAWGNLHPDAGPL